MPSLLFCSIIVRILICWEISKTFFHREANQVKLNQLVKINHQHWAFHSGLYLLAWPKVQNMNLKLQYILLVNIAILMSTSSIYETTVANKYIPHVFYSFLFLVSVVAASSLRTDLPWGWETGADFQVASTSIHCYCASVTFYIWLHFTFYSKCQPDLLQPIVMHMLHFTFDYINTFHFKWRPDLLQLIYYI